MSSVTEYLNYIDGKYTGGDSVEFTDVINPANSRTVFKVAKGTEADVDRAVQSARQALESGVWSGKTPEERANVLINAAMLLFLNKDKLANLESVTSGGTIRRTSTVDIAVTAATFYMTALTLKELPRIEHAMCPPWIVPVHSYWKREPVGVCAGITPWNYPMILAAWKIAPALAMGNSIVVKPASTTPVTTLEMAGLLRMAGLPAGVFNVVCGPGGAVGERLVTHPDVDKVAFTGSTEVGRRIARLASDSIKRVTLELGGKSPLIILDDADMDLAVNVSLFAFLLNSGQVCESGTRLFVPRHRQQELAERMVEKIKKMTIGDQLDMATDLGPIANAMQLDTIINYVKTAQKEGAELAYGGQRLTGGDYGRGFFFAPTIFINCRNDMTIAREEIFGPVQCVIPYDDVEEAVAMANDTIYGLAAGICGKNVAGAQKLAARLRAGTVWINTWHVLRPDAPFGGYKQSGLGRENCYHALLNYSEVKHICQDLTPGADDKFFNSLIGLNK